MMFGSFLLLAVGLAGPVGSPAANPYEADLRAALADARRLGPAASFTRYLGLSVVLATMPEADRAEWQKRLDLWVNAVSREADLYRPRRVGTVLAVDILAVGWDPRTWEALADEDPYYHVQVDLVLGRPGQRMYFPKSADGVAGWYEVKVTEAKRVPAIAPWLPAADAAELVARTQSAAPLVDGVWWFTRAVIQENRKGTGYYDWLKIKDRKDFQKLVALDAKISANLTLEQHLLVARSGVSRFSRRLQRLQSVTGGYWFTEDRVTDNLDRGNPLRNLDADYVHQAERHFGVLPNRLFTFLLCDDKGARQDTAPDGVGFDHGAAGTDGKIHIGMSCYGCHKEGLRPVNEWARKAFAPPNALNSPDPATYQRLKRLYLSEYQENLDDDNAVYAKRLLKLTGWKPEEASKAVAAGWAAYQERDILPAQAAAQYGVTIEVYLNHLRAYLKANPLGDNVIASHTARPPIGIRSDDWETVQPILAPIILASSSVSLK